MDEAGARKRIAAGQEAVRAARGRTKAGTKARTKRGRATPPTPAKPARNPRANPPAVRELVADAVEAGADVVRARWRDVLGAELAARVALACAAAGEDPAEWCRRQLAEQVVVLERRTAARAATGRARSRCAHPEKDRRGLRCGACGARGLPAVT